MIYNSVILKKSDYIMTTIQKVALITGAARRIGASIAKLLHKNGFQIALHYFSSKEDAIDLCHFFNNIREQSAIVLHADLSETTELNNLVKSAAKEWGRLDVLINNASRFY